MVNEEEMVDEGQSKGLRHKIFCGSFALIVGMTFGRIARTIYGLLLPSIVGLFSESGELSGTLQIKFMNFGIIFGIIMWIVITVVLYRFFNKHLDFDFRIKEG